MLSEVNCDSSAYINAYMIKEMDAKMISQLHAAGNLNIYCETIFPCNLFKV